MSTLLSIEDLHTDVELRGKPIRAVDGVSLELRRGEMLGLVGESGCGKTLLALSILDLLPPGGRIVGGRILLGDIDLLSLPESELRTIRGNRIGMVFQDPMGSLNPTMPIGAQVAESVRLHRRVSKQQVRDRVLEVLQLVGLPEAERLRHQFPHELSGGMRQRAVIAMALACQPEVIIADEPTSALDVTIQAQILELLDDLRYRLGLAVILVSHDLGVVAGRADRVAVMYSGKIVEAAEAGALFSEPRHPYTNALLQARPADDSSTGRRLINIPGQPPSLSAPPPGCRFAPRCGRATDACHASEPPLAAMAEGRLLACFHPIDSSRGLPTAAVTYSTRDQAEPPSDQLVEAEHVVKDFAARGTLPWRSSTTVVSAVADVSFTVAAGTTFGLVGESGSGKTTLGRLVAGLEIPTSGAVRVDGMDLTSMTGRTLRAARKNIHLMYQESSAALNPRMRVGAILREPLAIHGVGTRRSQGERVREMLHEVGLGADAMERYPHEFSGGQRQRIGLARALALEPKLIVADEPVSALDVSIQAQILNLMRDLQDSHGLTYLLISHDLSVVRYIAASVGVMYLGKLVEIGSTESIYLRPAHPYTRALIDAVPQVAKESGNRRPAVLVSGDISSPVNPPSGCRFRTRCPRAEDVCASEEPPLVQIRPNGHWGACHFPLG